MNNPWFPRLSLAAALAMFCGACGSVPESLAPDKILHNGKIVTVDSSFSLAEAVAIRDGKSGEVMTASAEDRQWAVAQPGQCVEARLLRYPPWKLEKAGTFYGARLLKLSDCKSGGK